MKALVMTQTGAPLAFKEVPDPEPAQGRTIVRLHTAALNHRDLWITLGQYAGIKTPVILGSDGAGTVGRKKVLINPSINWKASRAFPPKSFKILGLPDDGTFAEEVMVPSGNIFPKPAHLDFQQAAALPLAGLTAYRVLFSRCKLKAKDRVLISGVGGGVALMAMQMAVANGNEVWVTSGSPTKIRKAIALGAAGGVRYTADDWDKKLYYETGGFDVIIDSAAGEGFARLVKVAKPGARIGLYGGTTGKIQNVIPQIVFWKQISILGSTMGSAAEFSKMLDFVLRKKVIPVIDSVYALKDGNKALRRMKSGKQFGKIVLQIR